MASINSRDGGDRSHRARVAMVTGAAVALGAVAAAAVVAGAVAPGAPAGARITGSEHVTEIFTYLGPTISHSHDLTGHDVWTGVLGDHGRSTTTGPTATVETLHFTRGTVRVNDKAYFDSAARIYPGGESTCSQSGTFDPGKVRVIGGTGAYAGITGTLI